MTVLTQTKENASTSSLRGAMLVAGTCIGGGMLAMPIQTAHAGFLLSALILFASWVFMTFTGFLLVEATLWLANQSHFSSIAQHLLGPWGRVLSLIVYLFMNCTSLVAYTSGGANLVNHWLFSSLGITLSYTTSCILFTLLFGSFVYLGVTFIGKVNLFFTFCMGIIYCYLIYLGFSNMRPELLVPRDAWGSAISSFPLMLAAFSYQMVVPSLCSYLNYDLPKLKKAIWIGTTTPFAFYCLWLLMIHSVIPFKGVGGLEEAFFNNSMIVEPLKIHLSHNSLMLFADGFAFFALTTSYLGLSIALFDFVRDLFRKVSITPGKGTIMFLSIFPCMILAILFPGALLDFLNISGGFGDTLLSGLIPISMVWVGRYRKEMQSDYQVVGGKTSLIAAACFATLIFVIQWRIL